MAAPVVACRRLGPFANRHLCRARGSEGPASAGVPRAAANWASKPPREPRCASSTWRRQDRRLGTGNLDSVHVNVRVSSHGSSNSATGTGSSTFGNSDTGLSGGSVAGAVPEKVAPPLLERVGLRGLDRTKAAQVDPEGHARTVVSTELLNRLLRIQAIHLARSEDLRPVSMHEILDCQEPHKLAKFIQTEVPKRMAVRIGMLESLKGWQEVPELLELHTTLCAFFRKLSLTPRHAGIGLREFTQCIRGVRKGGRRTLALAAAGMHRLHHAGAYDAGFLDNFLDDYLLSRIGSNMLMDQYIALARDEDGGRGLLTGVIDRNCNPTKICRQAAVDVEQLCEATHRACPRFVVENWQAGKKGVQPTEHCTFSYIPYYLRYIMVELLKNSFHATVKNSDNEVDLRGRPVHVLVCSDETRVAIRVSDRAGGIPFEVGDRIWSYLYGAAARSSCNDDSGPVGTDMAGWGVGLPLSRLHARYLGGKLEVASFPGFGTDAYLLLPKIEQEQVESMPRANSLLR